MFITIISKPLLLKRLANQCQISCGAFFTWEVGKKVYINGQGHMTKMAAMLIYMVKTFKNRLLQNQKSYDVETWHIALGAQALQNLYK